MQTKHPELRMYLGLATLLLVILLFGLYAISQTNSLVQATNNLYRHPFTVGTNVRDIYSNILEIHRDMKDVALADDIPKMESVLLAIDSLEKGVQLKIAVLKDRFLGSTKKVSDFETNFNAWQTIRQEVIDLASKGQHELAIAITQGKGRQHVESLLDQLRYLIKFANQKAFEFHQSAEKERDHAVLSIFILLLLSVASSCIIAALIAKSISQRKIQIDKLRESEEKIATTLRCIGDGLIVTDINGYVTQLNPIAQQLTGWPAEEAIGLHLDSIFKIINEGTRQKVKSPAEKVMETGRIIGMANHTLLLCRDGREIPIADSAAPIQTEEDKKPLGVVIVFRDQLEERMAEMQITHLNQVLRAIRKVNQLITHCKDPATLLQEACECLTTTRGYNYAWIATLDPSGNPQIFVQAGGDGDFSYFSECIQNGHYPECVRRALSQKELYLIENVHQNCSNCEFANLREKYKAFVKSLWHEDTLYGVIFAHIPSNITPTDEEQEIFCELTADLAYALHGLYQEKNHAAMQKQVTKQQQLLDLTGTMAKVGGWEYSPSTNDFYYTAEVSRIHGFPEGAHITLETIYKKYSGDYQTALETAILSASQRSNPFDIELSLKEPGSEQKWIRATGRPLEQPGGGLLVSGTFQDITQRHDMQNRLRQREKMEAVGQLAGGIAHDFNNQLACIMGYAEILQSVIHDKTLLEHVHNIITAASHSANLTRQLLAYSRKGKFLAQPVDLDLTLDEVISFINHSFDKRITVKKMLRTESPMVTGDPSQLQNAILNLALNSRDAMPEGGELTFILRRVHLEDKAFRFEISQGEYLELSVSDTGCGIPQAILEHIYEPFFTTKEQGKGTGLGLSSVFGTVKSHKGAISVYSEPGKGTCIKLFFPALKAPPPNKIKHSKKAHKSIANARILVVDDEKMVCDLLTGALKQLGYSVIPFTDPLEALEFYRQSHENIDLVILDMVMPQMNGRDLFSAMKHTNPSIKAILSSGYSVNDEVQRILDAGVLHFLQKPFQLSDISEAVYNALS